MIACFAAVAFSPTLKVDYASREGLTVSVAGVPIIAGSNFQYYAPGWKKGYYSSNYNEQAVITKPDGSINVTFQGASGKADGELKLTQKGNTIRVDATFRWNADEPALVENVGAMLWGPGITSGSISSDGSPAQTLVNAPKPSDLLAQRQFGGSHSAYAVSAPWGSMNLSSLEGDWTLFDGRNYPEGWANQKSLFWFGNLALPVSKGHPGHVVYELTVKPDVVESASQQQVTASTRPTVTAKIAVDDRLPLLPYPKKVNLSGDEIEVTGAYRFPIGPFMHWSDFTRGLAYRFSLPAPAKNASRLAVDGGVSNLYLPHEAFRITVTKNRIQVLGQDDAGLRFGLRRLALLAYSRGGRLYLPVGTISDWPSTDWRGFHLFVGPNAVDFQRSLVEKVFLPMGLNKAVIQCERTAWDSMPNVRGGITMPKSELSKLFDMYRAESIEPIPLVQSFGHMEWAFDHQANLDIAFNPKVPYAVDPRIPRTTTFLTTLWDEVIQTTKAKTVHFGCDEVDMRGFPEDPALVTSLWQKEMPILNVIAKAHNVQMMIWGDKGLAPGEAPDAALGDNPVDAKLRREAIPKGSFIGDWHYKNDPNFLSFMPSLELWKSLGLRPVASSWYPPENARSFAIAAVQAGAGTLQTTWAGYESNSQGALENFDQFAAFVLNAEYAWSGRQDPIKDLGYDYKKVFKKLFYDQPISLQSVGGTFIQVGEGPFTEEQVGPYHFSKGTPVSLYSAVDAQLVNAPRSLVISMQASGSRLLLLANTAIRANVGASVALVRVEFADGTTIERALKYGQDLRAIGDREMCPLAEQAGDAYACSVGLSSKPQSIRRVTITALDSTSGFRLMGLTLLK